MKVVVFGCQKIAVDAIDFINNYKCFDGKQHVPTKLCAVITHDENRDRMFGDMLVGEYCNKYNIPTHRFEQKVDAEIIKKYDPDIIFSIYYRKILPKSVLDIPSLGSINLHPGELPRDRGPNPTLWVVKRGAEYASATLHYIDEGMDTGDIIAQTTVSVDNRTGFELNKYMMSVGLELFKDNYDDIICGRNHRLPQNDSEATCNISFTNNMRYIDWNQPAESVIDHIRAFAKPYAGSVAVTTKGTVVTIHNATLRFGMDRASAGPGCYMRDGDKLIVQTHTIPVIVDDFVCDKKLKRGRFISGVPE